MLFKIEIISFHSISQGFDNILPEMILHYTKNNAKFDVYLIIFMILHGYIL